MSKITNKERAQRIIKIIETISPYNEDSLDWQQGITDIMHLCEEKKADPHGNDLDFEKELEFARKHFEAERPVQITVTFNTSGKALCNGDSLFYIPDEYFPKLEKHGTYVFTLPSNPSDEEE